MSKKIMLYVNSSKIGAEEIAAKVKNNLLSEGHQIIQDNPEFIIGFGGDGTLLRLLKDYKFVLNAKYIGINCGTVGFLQDFVYDEKETLLEQINEAKEEKVHFLSIVIETKDKVYKFNAINDFVVQNNNLKVLHADVHINEEYLENFVGSGLIFATQVGSTARNLSAGGSVVYPGVNTICMTPSEPTLISKMCTLRQSICLPQNSIIDVYPSASDEVNVIADGMSCFNGNCKKISIMYDEKYLIRLLRKNKSYTKKISETFI